MTPARLRPLGVALVAVTATALTLRVIGLAYGLPAVYNPDEVAIMARALSFAKGTLNPHNFLYPTFYFYVLFAWVATYLGWIWLTGGVDSVTELQQLYFTDPTGIYAAGRALGAVCGTLGVVALFRLAQHLFDGRVALAAAVFLAVAPLAVRDSHYVKHDVPATLAIIAAYVFIVRIWPRTPPPGDQRRSVVLAAVACGVAFSTHYYCVFLALPLAWAVIQRFRPDGWSAIAGRLLIAGGVSAVAFFALSPFLLVEPLVAWRDVTANRQIVIDRAVSAGAFAPAQRYLEILWTDSLGRGVVAAGLVGALWMLRSDPSRATLLLLFPVPFFVFITNTIPASRYLNPILPFIALFAAWALSRLADRFRPRRAAFWVAVGVLAVGPFAASIRSDLFFRRADTRTLAAEFIARTIPSGATILIQPYSVVLTPSRESLIEALTANLGSVEAASTKFRIQLSVPENSGPSYRLLWLGRGGLDAEKMYIDPAELAKGDPLQRLKQEGVAYVVLKRYNRLDPELMMLVRALSRSGRLMAEFSPYRADLPEAARARVEPFLHNTDTRIDEGLERPGPPLEIWQLHEIEP